MVTYPDQTRHLVVAGNYDDFGTWIFDLDSGIDVWRPGPELNSNRGASVQFGGNTFLAVGGNIGGAISNIYSDKIWQFNPDPQDERWLMRSETLKFTKMQLSAFLIPDDYALC